MNGWVGRASMGAASGAAITYTWGLGLHGNPWGGRVVMRGVGEGAVAPSFQLSRMSHPELPAQISTSSTGGWAEMV